MTTTTTEWRHEYDESPCHDPREGEPYCGHGFVVHEHYVD